MPSSTSPSTSPSPRTWPARTATISCTPRPVRSSDGYTRKAPRRGPRPTSCRYTQGTSRRCGSCAARRARASTTRSSRPRSRRPSRRAFLPSSGLRPRVSSPTCASPATPRRSRTCAARSSKIHPWLWYVSFSAKGPPPPPPPPSSACSRLRFSTAARHDRRNARPRDRPG